MAIARRFAHAVASACFAIGFGYALALDPSLEVSQYGHTAWRNRDGFAAARIGAIVQTPDGYLWLGTQAGLFRFDGVTVVPAPGFLRESIVRALLVAGDGTLWIGMWPGLASLKEGKLVTYPAFNGKAINALAAEDDGTLWVAAVDRQVTSLCTLRDGRVECPREKQGFDEPILALPRAGGGNFWAIGMDKVWRYRPEPSRTFQVPDIVDGLRIAAGLPDGSVLLPTRGGLVRVLDGTEPFMTAGLKGLNMPKRVFRDRDGGLWIGLDSAGLVHGTEQRVDAFGPAEGLTAPEVSGFFEDREGNIWVATEGGLDVFRSTAASSYSAAQGLVGNLGALAAARDGSIWVASSRAVYRMHAGRVTRVRAARGASLFEDRRGRIWIGGPSEFGYVEGARFVRVDAIPPGYVDAMAEDAHENLWIAHRRAGLVRLSPDGRIRSTAWKELGAEVPALGMALDPRDGSVWLGFVTGGIAHVVNDAIQMVSAPPDRPRKPRVAQMTFDDEGTGWAATEAGLVKFTPGRVTVLDRNAGLPCDSVHAILFDEQWAWLSTACGLVRIARSDLRSWVDAGPAKGGASIRARVLDRDDGIRGVPFPGTYSPRAVRATDGRIWMATLDGISVVDPAHLPFNHVVPPVHVERIVADRVAHDATPNLRLPPLPRDIEIAYTATSLVAPQRVRFKHKLEGRDREWIDAGNMRRAFYSDLPPGDYRFRVIAANDSGVWNEEGAALAFSIAPAWWQTSWFRALGVLAIALLLYGIYRMRVAHIARQFNMTLDARVNERMRIARDLHDTLLQSFHGLLLRLQTASQLWPSSEGKAVLDGTIEQAANAVTEGRDAVQGLRASATETNDLADAIRTLGETLAAEYGNGDPPLLRVEVLGASRALHPILRDEIFRIAGEAMRNAFRHSHAKQVEVEIRYDARQLRLRIRDDGKGIDTEVLAQGAREGHYGLPGMRERAQSIEGKLTVWSAPGAGAEVELAIPASHAYTASAAATQP
jgi:signal transduction histidine kinase/ligand-binding sensor domain-containing protein